MNYNPPEEYNRACEKYENDLKVSCAKILREHLEKKQKEKELKFKKGKR